MIQLIILINRKNFLFTNKFTIIKFSRSLINFTFNINEKNERESVINKK